MSTNSSSAASNAKALPKDAQLMASILKDMGVTEYEPKVINQVLVSENDEDVMMYIVYIPPP